MLSNRPLTFFLIVLVLSGCTTMEPYGYTGKEGDAKMVVTSRGMPMNVEYAVSSNGEQCEGFKRVGLVRDTGRGVLLPWIAKLSEKVNQIPNRLEIAIPVNKTVYVRSYGKWNDSTSKGSCGPLVYSFVPEASRTYLVEFVWNGMTSCSSRISDITDPINAVSIQAKNEYCPRSTMQILLD